MVGVVIRLRTFKVEGPRFIEYRWRDIYIERKESFYEIFGLEKHPGIIMLRDPDGLREFLREEGVVEPIIDQVLNEVYHLDIGQGVMARVPTRPTLRLDRT